ncbi:tRNA lysidine(34) synthetase TilS [Leucobacter chromiireducens]|uniref:tRNA lysidine(34) synthetase TilS n=1 Tax=Leucobacter chromiireducens TaxID=283877 RepID=UPI003F80F978
MSDRPLLDTRRAVRRALASLRARSGPEPLVLVALSGGADSLALAAATAVEAPKLGVRAGVLLIDHGLQTGSAEVAERAGEQARTLGLGPVLVRRVRVAADAPGGPEAAARDARYAEFRSVAAEAGASAILTGHTRSDQAEQVLLGLARGSGSRTLAGIPERRPLGTECELLRPFLGADPEITREVTRAACERAELEPWDDPHNNDDRFARVRVRRRVLPVLAEELGEGISAALARSADLAREDADALDAFAAEALAGLRRAEQQDAVHAPGAPGAADHEVLLPAAGIAGLPAAIRNRVIRLAGVEFGAHLSREHTLALAALATDWRGQGPVFVPGIRGTRAAGLLRLTRQTGSPREKRD